MHRLHQRFGSVVALALFSTACSSSDEGGAGKAGAPSDGASGTAGVGGVSGDAGAGGTGNAAGANAGGGAAGSGSSSGGGAAGTGGGTAGTGTGGGSAGTGGWAGGAHGTVIADDPTAARTWPKNHGDALISLWRGDALAAFTVTIDDNTAPDHAWWVAQAKTYALKLTWFVITGHVAGNFGGTWPGFANLVAEGHDVQSHTVTALSGAYSLDDEYKLSQKSIEQNLPGVQAITLAYPGGNTPVLNDPTVAGKYYVGARGGSGGHNNKIGTTDYMEIASVSGKITLATDHWAGLPNTIIKNPAEAKSFRAWHCIHYHLLNNGTKADALAGFQWVQGHANDFWVGLFRETVLYGRERDTATLTVPHVSADKVVVEVKDSLPDNPFNFPLSVKVGLNSGWNGATAVQNGKPVSVQIVQHAGMPYAIVDAVPDRGPVTLTRT